MDFFDDLEVIIPTYNRAALLKKTLSSFYDTHNSAKINLTIVDSASTDNTTTIVNDYIKNKSNVKYIKFEDNLGMFSNFNRAFDLAHKRFVHILHDDDLLESSFYTEMKKKFIVDRNIVFVHCAASLIDEFDKTFGEIRKKEQTDIIDGESFIKSVIKGRNIVPVCPTVVIDKKLVPTGLKLFDDSHTFSGDLIAWMNLARFGNIGYINKKLLKYRIHNKSGTFSSLKSFDNRIRDRLLFRENALNILKKSALINAKSNINKYLDKYIFKALSRDCYYILKSEMKKSVKEEAINKYMEVVKNEMGLIFQIQSKIILIGFRLWLKK